MALGIGVAVLLVVVAFGAMLGTWASRYRKVGPDEVLIISGRRRRIVGADRQQMEVGYRIVRNGGTFVWPVVERVGRLSLRVMNTEVVTTNAMSKEGVPLEVAGTALFKVSSSNEGITNAAERYLGRSEDDIEKDVKLVLEGHLRGVCGTLTPEQIYQDRNAFQAKIVEQA
ncbi:MAG: flotillin family protein [SAR202 cluster bacterium]|nr:flotillin family protein [SAR202 cluster bacterium]